MKVSALFKDSVYLRFVAARPVATAAQLITRRVLDKEIVDQLFRDNAALQYEQSLLFSGVAKLMMSVTLGEHKSVNAAYKKMFEQLGVSITSIYNKLQRIEPQTSRALVLHAYQSAVEIMQEIGGVKRNLLGGYSVRMLDGNHLAGTEHRIEETRALKAAPLPGKSLVVFDPRYDCVSDYFPIEDGHAQELSALDRVIETLERKQLWIADRNFCTLKFMYEIAAKGACFVIRHHRKLHGTETGKLKYIGTTATAKVYENMLVLPEYGHQTITIRRVVCKLFKPTQSGETEVILLTNLPMEDADGVRISELYLDRWQIEKVFHKLTMSLNCEIHSLCYPPAALFCFGMSLIAYNSIAILKCLVAKVHGQDEASKLSHYHVASEIGGTTDGLLIAVPEQSWTGVSEAPLTTLVKELLNVAEQIDMRRYRKSVRGPKVPPPKRKGDHKTTHVSTKRLIKERQ